MLDPMNLPRVPQHPYSDTDEAIAREIFGYVRALHPDPQTSQITGWWGTGTGADWQPVVPCDAFAPTILEHQALGLVKGATFTIAAVGDTVRCLIVAGNEAFACEASTLALAVSHTALARQRGHATTSPGDRPSLEEIEREALLAMIRKHSGTIDGLRSSVQALSEVLGAKESSGIFTVRSELNSIAHDATEILEWLRDHGDWTIEEGQAWPEGTGVAEGFKAATILLAAERLQGLLLLPQEVKTDG